MTNQERSQIGEYWLGLAQMYGKQLTPISLKIMLDAISDLPANQVMMALNEWPKVSKRRDHPLPSDIREIIAPEFSIESRAREIVSRIQECVRKLGYNAAWPEVEAFVGPDAAKIIRQRGGWYKVCVEEDIFEPAIVAQIRDRAKDIVQYGQELSSYDQLEAPKEKQQLNYETTEAQKFLESFHSNIKTVTPKGGNNSP